MLGQPALRDGSDRAGAEDVHQQVGTVVDRADRYSTGMVAFASSMLRSAASGMGKDGLP
jgi:hypothetical protein